MANKSGLGSKELWAYMTKVEKEFNAYAGAHNHYVSAGGNAAFAGYTAGQLNSSHAHVINDGWPVSGYHGGIAVTPEEMEQAKPFIRLVIERMLDLLDSEEKWVKGQATSWNHEAKVEQFCLIGAQARAISELGLTNEGNTELDRARRIMQIAIQNFLDQCIQATGYTSMPTFNDTADTTFEDMRLWLKGTLDKLDD